MKTAMTRSLTIFGSVLLVLLLSSAANAQCTHFAGRAKEMLCPDGASMGDCMMKLKAGTYDMCVQQGKPESRIQRATPAPSISRSNSSCPNGTARCGADAFSFA